MDNRAGNFRRDTLYIRTRSDLDNSHDVYFLMTQLARSSFVYTHTYTHVRIYVYREYTISRKKPNTVFLIGFGGNYVTRTTIDQGNGDFHFVHALLIHRFERRTEIND